MRVLVTGATGVVGCNLVRVLLHEGLNVRVLVRPGSDIVGLRRLPVEYFTGNVLDEDSLIRAAERCSLLFHAAAVFAYSGITKVELDRTAISGTRNVLAAAAHAGVERVVVTSSTVTMGSNSTPEVRDESNEDDEKFPCAYTQSKVQQEKAAFEAAQELGLDLVVVCPGLTVGAYDYRLSPSNASIVNYLNDPMRFTFPGGCNIVSARDVAAGHLIAARHGVTGKRYIVGGDNLSWRDAHGLISALAGTFGPTTMLNHTSSYLAAAVAETSAKLMGKQPAVTRDEAAMACRFYWYSSAAIGALGYTPMLGREALAEALAWLIHRAYLGESVTERLQPDDRVQQHLHRFSRAVA